MASSLKQIPECLLARLWKQRAAREESLRAGDGRRFRVIYPGRMGTTAGPDFRGAVLEEEGGVGLVRGDVEVHVRQRDWDSHGHGRDPRYNGVVLHVVAGMDTGSTTLQSGRRVPVLSMEPLLDAGPMPGRRPDLWPLLIAHEYVSPREAPEMGILLDSAGDSWFLEKSDEFLREEDREQVLYAALMEALGYSQNQGPFLELAHKVPYSLLRRAVLESPLEDRVGLLQEGLLTAAGFTLPFSSNAADQARGGPVAQISPGRAYVLPRGSVGGRAKVMSQIQWRLFRVRPQNHPRHRIMGFAYLLDLFLPSSPSSADYGAPSWARRGLVEGMTSLVVITASSGKEGRWSRALESGLVGSGGTNLDGRMVRRALIGRGRARDMAVNCVLPFLHALAQLNGEAWLAQLSLEAYRKFPRLQENQVTREMRQELFAHLRKDIAGDTRRTKDGGNEGRQLVVYNARRQQGLLHLHHLISSPRVSSIQGSG